MRQIDNDMYEKIIIALPTISRTSNYIWKYIYSAILPIDHIVDYFLVGVHASHGFLFLERFSL